METTPFDPTVAAAGSGSGLAGGTAGGGAGDPTPASLPGNGPLPSVQEILDKRAAGLRLSHGEAGRLGAWVRGNRKAPGPAPRNAPRGTRSADLGAAPLGGGLGDAGSDADLVPPPVDPDLCKNAARQLLETADDATLAWLESLAVKAGADGETWQQFRARAELKPAAKTTLIDTSPHWLPALLRKFGFDVENAPSFLAAIALLSWGFGVGSVAASLKKKAQQRGQRPPAPAPAKEPPKAEG